MNLEVILGALIMLIGVCVGFGFTLILLRRHEDTGNVYNSHTYYGEQEVDRPRPTLIVSNWSHILKKNLEKVLELLREHHSKPIPIEVGDEIEELVQNVLDRMNPGEKTPAPDQS